MAVRTREQLATVITRIRDARNYGENSPTRVGSLLEDLLDSSTLTEELAGGGLAFAGDPVANELVTRVDGEQQVQGAGLVVAPFGDGTAIRPDGATRNIFEFDQNFDEVASLIACGPDTGDAALGARAELVASVEASVYDDDTSVGTLNIPAFTLLREANQTDASLVAGRVYVFEVLLDLRLSVSVRATAICEITAWRGTGANVHYAMTAPRILVGQGELYSWENATLTVTVNNSFANIFLEVDLDLTAVSGTYATAGARVSVKHAHYRTPAI